MGVLSKGKSLSNILGKAPSGLSFAANVLQSSSATSISVLTAGRTVGFNNQLNGYLIKLNAARNTVESELQKRLALDPNYQGMRGKAVDLTWDYEFADVNMGGRGTVEGGWDDRQIQQMLEGKKPKVYGPDFGVERTPEVHHINNVANHKDLQANPDNGRIYRTREEHVDKGHSGNVKNPSSGELIDKNAKLRQTNAHRVFRNELRGVAVSAGVGFGVGFTLSAIAELAATGLSAAKFGQILKNSLKAGAESAFVSTLGYGSGRLVAFGLERLGVNLAGREASLIGLSSIGLASIIAISLYQYAKLRICGANRKKALKQVGRQNIFSISTLALSVAAQGIFGGYAGVITSASIGIVYFGYNVAKLVMNRREEEKLRAETAECYKELALSKAIA